MILFGLQPNDSLTWCAGYKVGYEVDWAAAAVLGTDIATNNDDNCADGTGGCQ